MLAKLWSFISNALNREILTWIGGTLWGRLWGQYSGIVERRTIKERRTKKGGPTIICKNNGDCQNEIHSHNQLGASNDDMDAFLKHVTQHR